MKRTKANRVTETTKEINKNREQKYDFLSDGFLKKVSDDNLNVEDVIKITSLLQNDIFKIPNKIVSITDVSTLKTLTWTIGDIFICQIEQRFVVLHYKNSSTIFYKDSTGAPISETIAKSLPHNVSVKSNIVNDVITLPYNHLVPISNIEIIIRTPDASFETFNGFTKSDDVDAFRKRLFRALKILQSNDYIAKELRQIENKDEFKKQLKAFIEVECKKYCVISDLAKQYTRILEEEANAFEKEGKPRDDGKLEAARKAFLDESKNYSTNVLQTDENNEKKEYQHSIAMQFPNESKHFQNIFQYLANYEVDDSFMMYIELISKQLGIDFNDLKYFFSQKKDCLPTLDSSIPSVISDENKNYILDKYAEPVVACPFKENRIRSLDELLKEIKTINSLSDDDVEKLKDLFVKTMRIFNNDWNNATTKAVHMWAKQKRGNLAAKEICEALAVCIRAQQIVSRGLITVRDIQILTALLLLTTNNGNFAQIATGEGKTIITALLTVVKVLEGRQVDIITSNEVLANEGLASLLDFYSLFNILADTNNYDPKYKDGPRRCYGDDVVYGNIGNFQFDYLRHSFEDHKTRGTRRFDFLILDEMDSLTIDNGAYIAKLAQPFPGVECLKYVYIKIWIALLKAEQTYNEIVDSDLEKIAKQTGNKSEIEIQEEWDQYFLESIQTMADKLKAIIKNSNPLDIPVVPNHLKAYCQEMIDKWIDNAIYAKYHCHENEDYVLKKMKKEDQDEAEFVIVPVDYANTGVILTNTIWSNGLHQFVQLKHNVKINSESLTASFISNIGYINLYNNNMVGITGTLGSHAEQTFLSSIFNLKYLRIPTFKPKHFKELGGMVVQDKAFHNCIVMTAYLTVKANRSILIICKTISEVQILRENIDAIIEIENAKWIKTRYYYDESNADLVLRDKVGPCEIIVATNIAGRGTDFKSTKQLDDNGGLYVCLTFLPDNERVEQQAYGRTSRQGNYGTAQLIIRASNVESLNYTITESTTMDDIKDHRNRLESEKLAKRKDKIKEVLFEDKLFQEFAKTYRDFVSKQEKNQGGMFLTFDLKERWAFWLRSVDYKGSENVNVVYDKFLQAAKPILNGTISFNPYYAVKQADYFIQNDNYQDAQASLEHAIRLSKSDSLMYPAYLKMFEICILNGGAMMERFLMAVKKIVFIPENSENRHRQYKKNAIEALEKAQSGITTEVDYITREIIENEEFCKCLIPPHKDENEKETDSKKSNNDESLDSKNALLKHIYSRYYILLTFQNHILSLIEELKKIEGGVTFHGKIENYIKDLKPSNDSERMLKKHIYNEELSEMSNVAVSTIYNIREVYDVSNVVIRGAQVQITAGLAILAGSTLYPPAMIVGAPAAGALIAEGLTDIIIDLIRQGDAKFELVNYVKAKCISYLVSVITIGFSLLAQCQKVLKLAMKTCNGIAAFLKKSKILTGLFTRLANMFQTYALRLAHTIKNLSTASSLISGVTLSRLQVLTIGLSHVGIATGINLAGALVGEFVISKSVDAILKNSKESILAEVRGVVNRKFAAKLQHANMDNLRVVLEQLSRGTIGQLSWDIFKNVASSLVQTSHSWKIKAAGFTLFSLGKCYEIITYADQFCDEIIKAMNIDRNVQNSEEHIKAMRATIAESITNDIHSRIVALASSTLQTFVVNPLMSKAIKKVMGKLSNQGHDDSNEEMSFKKITDAYKLLELPEGASEKEIQKAYRDLAAKYHPNSRKMPNAEKFMAINAAKERLVSLHRFMADLNVTTSNPVTLALPAPKHMPMAHKGNIETLSRSKGEYIVVINEDTAEKTHFGADYGGEPLEVHYKPPKEDKAGHFFVKGRENELMPTGTNNCLYDSLALIWKERGKNVTATELRIKATSLSFTNMKYNVINNISQVFNNKITENIYNEIQSSILVGGREFRSVPLIDGKYPSGEIEMTVHGDCVNALVDLQDKLYKQTDDAKTANVLAPAPPRKAPNTPSNISNMNPDVTKKPGVPVMGFVPHNEDKRKTSYMMGSMYVKFEGEKEGFAPLKLVSVSGSEPFIEKIYRVDEQTDNYRFKYKDAKYKPQIMKFAKNKFTFVDPGKVDVTEIFDVHARKLKPLQNPSEIMKKNETVPTSCCAGVKLLTHVGKHMQTHKHLKIAEIYMAEVHFNPDNPPERDQAGNIKLTIQSSCDRCKHILPQMLGKYDPNA